MTPIHEQTDCVIRRLKTQESMRNVRFVRAFSDENIETPIHGFLAAVSIISTSQSQDFVGGWASSGVRGCMYTAEVEIRVYSPYHENGNGLSELVSAMLTGLKEADEEKLITAAAASSIEFDNELNSVFRKLCFTMEFCLCEEGSA